MYQSHKKPQGLLPYLKPVCLLPTPCWRTCFKVRAKFAPNLPKHLNISVARCFQKKTRCAKTSIVSNLCVLDRQKDLNKPSRPESQIEQNGVFNLTEILVKVGSFSRSNTCKQNEPPWTITYKTVRNTLKMEIQVYMLNFMIFLGG